MARVGDLHTDGQTGDMIRFDLIVTFLCVYFLNVLIIYLYKFIFFLTLLPLLVNKVLTL